jgi:hypothetical protein
MYFLIYTCEKSWKNYYNHYNDKEFKNDVIIKCDDDIVFIDLYKLPKFINFVKNNNYDVVFANTINNGVSAYYQQNKFNLIPKKLLDLEYPKDGRAGRLWRSGSYAEILHTFFIKNYKQFLDHDYNDEIIPINTRFSINFIGLRGCNFYKFVDCGIEDEYKLTVEHVKKRNFKNVLYADFYVSHLSSRLQVESGINLIKLLDMYKQLYNTIIQSERFKKKY